MVCTERATGGGLSVSTYSASLWPPHYCSWLVVGYSVLSHPLDTGVETTATMAHPRNGSPALSPKVPPTVLVAKYHPLC